MLKKKSRSVIMFSVQGKRSFDLYKQTFSILKDHIPYSGCKYTLEMIPDNSPCVLAGSFDSGLLILCMIFS